MINGDQLTGRWFQLKGAVKLCWGRTIGDELLQIKGDYDLFIGLVRKRYGDQLARERLVERTVS
jgi:uncharacterized protein YjbJ (UPF0337 family)